MLYSIIPPVLIVLSLIGIILFLVKKSSKIKEEDLSAKAAELSDRRSNFFGKIKEKIRINDKEKLKNFWLGFLEKSIKKTRMVFLKFETKFQNWGTKIRDKRKNKEIVVSEQPVKGSLMEAEKKSPARVDIMERLKRYTPERKKPIINTALPQEQEEKVIKPMVGEKIVSSSMQSEKSKLEEILIERIAINPRDIEAYERLGEYYMETENFNFAKECFKQVMKLDPMNKNVRYKIRRLEKLIT